MRFLYFEINFNYFYHSVYSQDNFFISEIFNIYNNKSYIEYNFFSFNL